MIKVGLPYALDRLTLCFLETLYIQCEAYELIGTHTGRRTFINNMLLKKYPSYLIMKVTGHRSENAFKRYVNICQDEASEIFLKENNPHKNEL